MKVQKFCKLCGKEYYVSPYRKDITFYCSRSCSNRDIKGEHGGAWKGGKVELICSFCSGVYTLYPSQAETSKYCSESCRSKATRLHGEKSNFWKGGSVDHICLQCGIIFYTDNYRKETAKFCSQPCHDKWRSENKSGVNSHAWEGGITFLPYPPTFNNEFKHMIRERDNYTCAICKKQGSVIHHINYIKDDTTPENCITLCIWCHGKTNHNRSYWIEYFSYL